MKRNITLEQFLDALDIIGGGVDINVDGIDGIAVESPVPELTEEGRRHLRERLRQETGASVRNPVG